MIYLPEFFYLRESSIDLVAHRGDDIVDGDPALFIDESLTPDLGVNFVARLQVLADGVLILSNSAQLLAAVDVDAGLRLAKVSATKQRHHRGKHKKFITYVFTLLKLFPIDLMCEFLL